MKIDLTDKAIHFFEDEMGLEEGNAVRFFGKTYGSTEVHDGFSVGMTVDNPDDHNLIGSTEIHGVTYFTGTVDEWFFEDYNLEVDFNPEREELIFHFNN